MPRCWQRGLLVASEKKLLLAPCLLTQPLLAALPQGRAEPGSQEGGALGCLERTATKGNMLLSSGE